MKKFLFFLLALSLSISVYSQEYCIEGTYKITNIECLDYYKQVEWFNTWKNNKLKFKTSQDQETIFMYICDKTGEYCYPLNYQNLKYACILKNGAIFTIYSRLRKGCIVYDGSLVIQKRGEEPVYISFKPINSHS